MSVLVLVRHAKAVPKDEPVEDFDRPLSSRGQADAPLTGRWLAESGVEATLALCSPSLRTRETWQLIAPALAEAPPVVYDERLYNAPPQRLVTVLAERGGQLGSLLLVGHNPGLHELASALCGTGPKKLVERLRSGFPTSGAAVLELTGGWDALKPGAGRLTEFWSP
ncbi:histidine phosphatase family protein [Streptomyces sp. WAC06614]|uniref:SixA phosphatase family protein n=1 Tax=Streptomyces sp. WAC06614 TaxID=2487416 RepID=UPI000F7B0E5A|nr:histidine phosphatase family protein [Streptomyces sp. WAC06614]RSS78473.1 histidine phosphatase family protein [Streptomyces sp. WAC06614]